MGKATVVNPLAFPIPIQALTVLPDQSEDVLKKNLTELYLVLSEWKNW